MFAETTSAAVEPVHVVLFAAGCLACLIVMFVPALVAWARSHRSSLAIAAVCVFFGWTCVGWFVALVWSLTGDTDD